MSFFIIVPAISPAIGQTLLTIASWREIFYVLLASSLITLVWFSARQRETLKSEYKRAFSVSTVTSGFAEVAKNRTCLSSTLMAGLMLGAFYSFLMSSPQFFEDLYGVTDSFAYYFAILAICAGAVTLVNAKLVMKVGIRKLCKLALIAKLIASCALLALLFYSPVISFTAFMLWACIIFALQGGLLFGNLSSMAMEPVGHLAGIAAAFVATLSTGLGVGLGTLIGQFYNGTLIPMVTSFIITAILSLILLSVSGPKYSGHIEHSTNGLKSPKI